MASYREQLTSDLDRWVEAGLVPAESRAAILQSVPEGARIDAATTFAWVGAVLAGVALVAFVAANWDALPRLAKFALVLGLFGGGAGAAAWCERAGRPNAANGALTFAAFAFAAAVGLTGQIFDIAGNERTALYAAGAVAAALALAGRGSGPAIAALWLIGAADFGGGHVTDIREGWDFGGLVIAAPAAAWLAVRWRSIPLTHAAALALIAAVLWIGLKLRASPEERIALAAALAVLSAGGRWLRRRDAAGGGVFYGWLAWGAMAFYMAGGFEAHGGFAVAQRIGWLVLGAALTALGRRDRHGLVTAAGVLSLMIGISVVMYDLGLGLLAASAVFFLAALAAVGAGFALRRRPA